MNDEEFKASPFTEGVQAPQTVTIQSQLRLLDTVSDHQVTDNVQHDYHDATPSSIRRSSIDFRRDSHLGRLTHLNKSSQASLNMRQYNQHRFKQASYSAAVKGRHRESVSSKAETEARGQQEVEVSSEGTQSSAMSVHQEIKESRCAGNIGVSLFWEEKIVMIVRFLQLYGYLMLICYEVWPFQARRVWGPWFFFMIGSFQMMIGPDQYYSVLQSETETLINLCAYTFALLLLTALTIFTLYHPRTHFRLLRFKRLHFFKWGLWLLELSFLPILVNIVQFSTCQYYSAKQAIVLIDCPSHQAYPAFIVATLLAFGLGTAYITMLAVHLSREKVSIILHEEYIVKKEVEFTVGVSEMWLTRSFFAFSSFKGDLAKMYHRALFNAAMLALVLVHAVLSESQSKIGLMVGILAVILFYTIFVRPYRCLHSNVLLFLLSTVLLATAFLLMLKKGGLKSALFVESYFYGLLLTVNVFSWVLILAYLGLLKLTRRKWPLTKEAVIKAIAGQDIAILHIKKANRVAKKIARNKQYSEREKLQIGQLIAQLEKEFNHFRDRQPMLMDALTETLDHLRVMKRNYEENPYLYNFDYGEELRQLVKQRYRVFDTKQPVK